MRSRQIAISATLVLACVALGIWVSGLLRPRAVPAANPNAPALEQTVEAYRLHVTLRIDQTMMGDRTLALAVRTSDGAPADVHQALLRFTMEEMDMGRIEAEMQPVERGIFQARGPFFTMAGRWRVIATLARPDAAAVDIPFEMAIAAPGEISGPLNPFRNDEGTLQAGKRIYVANCAGCHGTGGRGDGPAGVALNPKPADLTIHMRTGKHADGQIFNWIDVGYPGSAMPAWGGTLSDNEIWQLITYLRTLATEAPDAPLVAETLPPMVFVRGAGLWRSDGNGAPPIALPPVVASGYVQHPAVAPDGRTLAIIGVEPAQTTTAPQPMIPSLYLVDADGTNPRALWRAEGYMLETPAWTPDGRTVYLVAKKLDVSATGIVNVQPPAIVRVDGATGAQQTVLTNALGPTLSHDGTRLIYVQPAPNAQSAALMIAAPDGSQARELVPSGRFAAIAAPRVAPDGKTLIFAAAGEPAAQAAPSPIMVALDLFAPPVAEAHGAPKDLWRVNLDGSDLRQLAALSEDDPVAAFSPDGAQIVVMGGNGIYLLDGDGSKLRRIDMVGSHGGVDWAR